MHGQQYIKKLALLLLPTKVKFRALSFYYAHANMDEIMRKFPST